MAAAKCDPVLTPNSGPQPSLLRRPRPPTKSSFVELVTRINSEKSKVDSFHTGIQSDIKLNTFVDSDTQFSDTYLGTSSDRSRESCAVLPTSKYNVLPRHHTSLLEVSSVTVAPRIGCSLVQPLKPRGPAPLIPSRPPRHKPNLIPVLADDDLLKYYQPPEFTLQDFIIKLSEHENVPIEQVERTVYSTFTYSKLQRILHERCQPRNTSLSTHALCWPADVPAAVSRVPQKQLLIEMAALIKEHLNKVSGIVMKSSFRPVPMTGHKFGMDSSACAEIVFYRDVTADCDKQFTQQLLETELPGTDSVIHGPTTKHFNGSKRTASPFETVDEGLISPRELGVLDSLLNGGRALSLKAQFISMLPDVQLLLDTIEYINLSYNNFQAIPTDIFSMSCLSVLLLRNNPLREIPTDIEHLQNLTICVFSFCLLTTLPYELFTLPHLSYLDVSYNMLALIPSEIRHSTSLEELNVQGNQLTSLPMNILQLNNLQRLQVANNFMHPLFWRNAVTNQPQSLVELSSIAVTRLKSVDNNNSSQQLLSVIEQLNASCIVRCDVCKGPRFGRGVCAVRPVSRLCGVKNIPILFQCCSVECKNRFMFAVDEELTDLLYGPKARTSR